MRLDSKSVLMANMIFFGQIPVFYHSVHIPPDQFTQVPSSILTGNISCLSSRYFSNFFLVHFFYPLLSASYCFRRPPFIFYNRLSFAPHTTLSLHLMIFDLPVPAKLPASLQISSTLLHRIDLTSTFVLSITLHHPSLIPSSRNIFFNSLLWESNYRHDVPKKSTLQSLPVVRISFWNCDIVDCFFSSNIKHIQHSVVDAGASNTSSTVTGVSVYIDVRMYLSHLRSVRRASPVFL